MSKINQTEVKNEAKFALGLWAIMILFANVIHPNALIIMTGNWLLSALCLFCVSLAITKYFFVLKKENTKDNVQLKKFAVFSVISSTFIVWFIHSNVLRFNGSFYSLYTFPFMHSVISGYILYDILKYMYLYRWKDEK